MGHRLVDGQWPMFSNMAIDEVSQTHLFTLQFLRSCQTDILRKPFSPFMLSKRLFSKLKSDKKHPKIKIPLSTWGARTVTPRKTPNWAFCAGDPNTSSRACLRRTAWAEGQDIMILMGCSNSGLFHELIQDLRRKKACKIREIWICSKRLAKHN